MIQGIEHPVFFIYDSTNTTFVEIIELSKYAVAVEIDPGREDVTFMSPLTKRLTVDTSKSGYRPTWNITVQMGQVYTTVEDYMVAQATTETDIYKMTKIQMHMDAGKAIRFWPRVDLGMWWKFQDEIDYYLVNTKIDRISQHVGGTVKTDSITMHVESKTRISTIFLEGDSSVFAYSKGLDLEKSSSQYCTLGATLDIGSVWTMEFVFTLEQGVATGVNVPVLLAKNNSTDLIQLTKPSDTRLNLTIAGSTVYWTTGDLSLNTKYQVIISKNDTVLFALLNGANLGSGTGTISSGLNFEIDNIGVFNTAGPGGTTNHDGFFGHLRIYDAPVTVDIAERMYSEDGRDFLYGTIFNKLLVLEFDESGGTGSTEDNQEGTATYDATLVNSPTRSLWPVAP